MDFAIKKLPMAKNAAPTPINATCLLNTYAAINATPAIKTRMPISFNCAGFGVKSPNLAV